MSEQRGAWALSGALSGVAGLAVSYLVTALAGGDESPVAAVAEQVIRLTPGGVAERAIRSVGHADKPLLVTGVIVVVTVLSGLVGLFARRTDTGLALPAAAYGVLAAVGLAAVLAQPAPHAPGVLGTVVGWMAWVGFFALLTRPIATPLGEESRRRFLATTGGVAAASVVAAYVGRVAGRHRREVGAARRALDLSGVTPPQVDPTYDLGVAHQPPWLTPADEFYRIDTAIVPPAVEPGDWRLRIHGMVDRPLELTFDELLGRQATEEWMTLNCVSNTVGGDLIGNAWWSGVRIAPLLAEAGVQAGADGVLQTSADGWTCLTPVEALTDDRGAMLAFAQNGEPLTVEHGFPVRVIVPGLYGYVSATKWVVDLEVTRFEDAQGYWTDKGWSAQGPVKLASRIDVPRTGDAVDAGDVVVAGTAWQQHTGIGKVEISVDGGRWQAAELGAVPGADTWVQWRATVALDKGDHQIRARATSAAGEVQTSVRAEPAPDGATGWHSVEIHVS
ncbi:DMSO/TMAO reductase YedYZ, molybdopterin-dependent catalytic subunit [Nocardioides terrae]|uniref:DMSO/TMAO reductase YedYZ, molybdopterin-dependent catalytic subunit n=1 Tax=Nocardioides terrae TaxID=574651 RepID=A0A1I1EH84_9ACTN|nr:molybdopterin-dependent oxidoreductase [Nocardioides terrae]SFB84728.1 DMSO/TMAO reductase YedYZ, molybdopterin-dependent catalytic subunit [Nocardioides terrae]